MTKRFSNADLVECAVACYEDGIVCGHGYMIKDFMQNTPPEIKDKYIKLTKRSSWILRNAISEIVYDNLKLFRAYFNNPSDKVIEAQIQSLLRNVSEFSNNRSRPKA